MKVEFIEILVLICFKFCFKFLEWKSLGNNYEGIKIYGKIQIK